MERWNLFFADLRRSFWIIAALKFVLFFGLWALEYHYGFRPTERVGWFFYGTDAHSYLDPVENLVDNGTYAMSNGPTAFRMPGFLLFYGPLYALFGGSVALHGLAVVNYIFDVLTAFLVFLMALRWVKPWLAFFVTALISTYPNLMSYGYLGMAETIAASVIIMSVYAFIKWRETHLRIYCLWMSGAITVMILMKPVTVLLLPLAGAFFIFDYYKRRSRSVLIALLIVVSIPTVTLTGWTVRNFVVFDKLIPLTSTLESRGGDQAFRSWCRRTGQEFQSWKGEDARVWFLPKWNRRYNEQYSRSNPFPDYIFTSEYNLDSLIEIRDDWHIMLDTNTPPQVAKVIDADIERRFWKYTNSFVRENKFHFLVTVRIQFLKNFFLTEDSFSPFAQNTPVFVAIRGYYFLSYYCIVMSLVLGVVSLFLGANTEMRIVVGAALVVVLIHIAMGRIENRYMLPLFPLYVLGLAAFVSRLGSLSQKDSDRM